MTVAEKLRKARIAKKWTQQKLASELGVSQNTVSSWERGETLPKLRRQRDVAETLGIPLHSLIPAAT